MGRWGVLALRISLGIVFIWFGILKPLGLSAAAPLVIATVYWLPLFDAELWVTILVIGGSIRYADTRTAHGLFWTRLGH
jgi:hypothetical protein